MKTKIEDTNLSGRIKNALIYNQILYVEEMPKITRYEFKNQTRNIGKKSYNELSQFLEKNNIEWR